MDMPGSSPIVVLISGSGSNLQAIINAVEHSAIDAEIAAVLSNRAQAYGLQRAQAASIPTEVVDHTQYSDRITFDRALLRRVEAYQPGLVVLAGFMRILSEEFVGPFEGRMLNIHPSLLPEFRGLHTHQRALDKGVTQHGCSVHFVTNELDGGPIVLQASVPVLAQDTPESLAARVLKKEHIVYPLCIRWFYENRLRLDSNRVIFDGRPLSSPLQLNELESESWQRFS
jgi:phosphoribosylglycinamide formyltransferase-1